MRHAGRSSRSGIRLRDDVAAPARLGADKSGGIPRPAWSPE